ncbi:hypothetical protein N7532_009821 [Penicillium argentinense]|uniref:WD40 repeat-like protein n=1 Tax=Penicillium argentinense TaxID=1131581 RepID=A0A9W9JXF8_9EURO|nr:uncharacterized protein N7532_009821 [Penicillium argentinense]KAJ5085050.1 hypothetical protein N7532_009821 [Penicillium argentinense]
MSNPGASSYRSRVSRRREPRNIPLEAEVLLNKFIWGKATLPNRLMEFPIPLDCAWADSPSQHNPQPSRFDAPQQPQKSNATSDPNSFSRATPSQSSTPDSRSRALKPISKNTTNTPPQPQPQLLSKSPVASSKYEKDSLRKVVAVHNASQQHQGTNTPRQATSAQRSHNTTSPRLRIESASSRTPGVQDVNCRRSRRSRPLPGTYNVRALASEAFGPEREDPKDDDRAILKPNSTNFSPAISLAVTPQASQLVQTPLARKRPDLGKFILGRQCGRSRVMHDDPIYSQLSSELVPWRQWKGASNDVVSLAWSPDGSQFAAGAVAPTDEYNRGNNLVLGNLIRNSLHELSDHWKPRPNPRNTLDPRLFTTVSTTQWVGDRLFTGSFDHTVKIWDVLQETSMSCVQTLMHTSQVEVMANSAHMPGRLVTGTHDGFRLWTLGSDPSSISLDLSRGPMQKNVPLVPTSLAWGQTPETKNFIIGGMAQNEDANNLDIVRSGHLELWRMEEASVTSKKLMPCSQNIFDIKWHPSMPKFATASPLTTNPKEHPVGTRSLVHIYTYQSWADKVITTDALPCPALDINEITFPPFGDTYVTASCTDGSTYVWDIRMRQIIHRLQHGEPLSPISHEYTREAVDVGVRTAVWGASIDQFYTGASDGVLKQWDIRRSPEDVLLANTASLGDGIMSSAFSPDKGHLLLGDSGGGIHVLSSGPTSDPEPGTFRVFFEHSLPEPESEVTAISAANELVSSGQLTMHPTFGPVQGPQYSGPVARWARKLSLDANASTEQILKMPLLEEIQLCQFEGPRPEDRVGLDQRSRDELRKLVNIAMARNKPGNSSLGHARQSTGHGNLTSQKRKRDASPICVSSDDAEDRTRTHGPMKKKKKKRAKARKVMLAKQEHEPTVNNPDKQVEIIDLTLEDDEDHTIPLGLSATDPQPASLVDGLIGACMMDESTESIANVPNESLDEAVDESLEDDHWWPDSGQVDANIPTGEN